MHTPTYFADAEENQKVPWAVPAVLQHVVGVCGVGEKELAVDGHAAAHFGLKAVNEDVVWKANVQPDLLHVDIFVVGRLVICF